MRPWPTRAMRSMARTCASRPTPARSSMSMRDWPRWRLSQLLENAARYSPADRPIVVEARSRPRGITITVTDGGPGLDPAELDHLFERFYRGRAAQQAAPGTGMGLAIAGACSMRLAGGSGPRMSPERGARFSMVVPGTTRARQGGA